MVSAAGYRMSFTLVDQNDLVGPILRVMPDAIITVRFVATAFDPNPHLGNGQYQTGQFWFNQLWPHMADTPDATFHQFVNEWEGNRGPITEYPGFASFYLQLGAACRPFGVVPTFGDFSSGTPPDATDTVNGEAQRYAALKPMFDDALLRQYPINMHLYSPEGAGAWDVTAGAPYYVLRFEQTAARFPGIPIVAGEGGNFGDGGRTFDAEKTPICMQQMARLLYASPYFAHFLGLSWWGVVDGVQHPDWKNDDITPILPWYFRWSLLGQPV